jgi:hypothetical protein
MSFATIAAPMPGVPSGSWKNTGICAEFTDDASREDVDRAGLVNDIDSRHADVISFLFDPEVSEYHSSRSAPCRRSFNGLTR